MRNVLIFALLTLALSLAVGAQENNLVVPGVGISWMKVGMPFPTIQQALGPSQMQRQGPSSEFHTYTAYMLVFEIGTDMKVRSISTSNATYRLSGLRLNATGEEAIRSYGQPSLTVEGEGKTWLLYYTLGLFVGIENGTVTLLGVMKADPDFPGLSFISDSGAGFLVTQATDYQAQAVPAPPSQGPRTPPEPTSRRPLTPGQGAGQASDQAPGRAPGKVPAQAPASVPGQGTGQNPAQAPAQAPAQVPAQAPASMPGQGTGQNPAQAPAMAPGQAPAQAPAQAPSQVPGQAEGQAPAQAAGQAPGRSAPGGGKSKTRSAMEELEASIDELMPTEEQVVCYLCSKKVASARTIPRTNMRLCESCVGKGLKSNALVEVLFVKVKEILNSRLGMANILTRNLELEKLQEGELGYYSLLSGRIHLSSGMRIVLLMGVVAHEYAHAWQAKGWDDVHKNLGYYRLTAEGFAVWVEYKFFEILELRDVSELILAAHNDFYQTGFRAWRELEEKKGTDYALKAARDGTFVVSR